MLLYLVFRGGWLDLAYGISGVWASSFMYSQPGLELCTLFSLPNAGITVSTIMPGTCYLLGIFVEPTAEATPHAMHCFSAALPIDCRHDDCSCQLLTIHCPRLWSLLLSDWWGLDSHPGNLPTSSTSSICLTLATYQV
jgi:hypothetical protein